ncbi:MAG: hypothetical protein ACYDC6_08665 [Acidobacteriaceae bacterium]
MIRRSAASQTATLLLKYDAFAKWQAIAVWLPNSSFSTGAVRVRTELEKRAS